MESDVRADDHRCAGCGRLLTGRRADATWCSARCRMRSKRTEQRREESREQLLAVASEAEHESHDDASLTELHARTTRHRRRDDPGELAPDVDADHIAQDKRINELMRQQQEAEARRPPSRIRPEWLEWGRRHGTEHPEQTRDRARRQQAEADAVRARTDQRYPYRAEDQYDRRTIGNMARRGQESRRLNAGHQDHGVLPAQEFDFNETVRNAGLYQRGAGTSGRARHRDYAWNMRDGW
jgi:hypothetical protein